MESIKIFTTQRIDKECDYLESDIFIPVRCGAVLDKNASNIQGDDAGENISYKRESYCELTTQYWAWKNQEADYYGFCHYRRYFCFASGDKRELELDAWNIGCIPYLDEYGIKKLNTDDEAVRRAVLECDIITPIAVDLNRVQLKSVRDQWCTAPKLHSNDLELLEKIITDDFPEYAPAAKQYLDGSRMYLCNMFIMRQDLFMAYSQWLFDVLARFEQQADMSEQYSEESLRTPGHLGERLFGIYLTYLLNNGKYRVREYPICNIIHPDRRETLSPAFHGQSVNIVLASSEYFAPYCAAAIQSVICHADPKRDYDIVVLEQEMQKKTKERLKSLIKGRKNISLRTYNTGRFFYQYQLFVCEHFSVETYFRLAIPEIFSNYDKVLYLDGDLIVKRDVAELYDTSVEGYAAAGALDVVGMGAFNGYRPDKVAYYKEYVRMKDGLMQMNGGVMLMNTKEIRRQYTTEELLRYAKYGHFDLADQDVLNSLFEGQIKWIDMAWNAACDQEGTLRAWVSAFAPKEYYEAYKKAIQRPKIIHYAGSIKPWHDPDYQMAEEFWRVIRETPFYDLVMYRRVIENDQRIVDVLSRQTQKAFNSTPVGVRTNRRIPLRVLADIFLPKGTPRRENVKKILCKLTGRKYVTPYYLVGKGVK